MKDYYAFLYAVCSIVALICVCLSYKKNNRIAICLRRMLYANLVMMLFGLLSLSNENHVLYKIGYGLSELSGTWVVYFALMFSIEYAGHGKHHMLTDRILTACMAADTLLFIINIFTDMMFRLDSYMNYYGELMYTVEYTPLFVYDVIMAYSMSMIVIYIFVRRIMVTPKTYNLRYIVMTMCIILIGGWSVVSLIIRDAVNYYNVAYALAASLLTYFVLFYRQDILTKNILDNVVENLSDAIFFFDTDERCIFANRFAKSFFDISNENIENSWSVLSEWLEGTGHDLRSQNYFCTVDRRISGESFHLEVEYKRLMQDGKKVGSFFYISDKTELMRHKLLKNDTA